MWRYFQADELTHYGVKGMKWGVRRWQNKNGSLTAAGKARKKNWQGDDNVGRALQKYTSPEREYLKYLPIAVARYTAAALIPGASLAMNAKTINDIRKTKLDGKDYTKKEGEYEKIKDLKKKSSQTSLEVDVKLANPRHGKQAGKINNCTLCTATMELRNRGYDVIARSKGSGNVAQIFSKWFKGAEIKEAGSARQPGESRKDWANRSYDNLCKEIEKQGVGASGYVGITYTKGNSGHAMWYKVGNDGNVTFYDGQNGKYGIDTDKTFAIADPGKHHYARLDNCALDPSVTESVRSNPKEERK